ncbi:MAG TPA: YigZ family protein [Bacteroidales bacterium]|nr:YigZ family protein [Bacteroidales bacterium]HNZ44005.1 YigZ family protein [Bacteroidales bacterium]HPB26384.1 YigZ family protein [Bacteroidales bacterium]HPI29883.1 YigZ family protein [Bacteroidales bacterium]HQN15846.1 YigZ family protein [Bacteroidales bacterium]
MLFEDTFLTVANVSESVFRDRGSRFIGIAVPVGNEAEMKQELEQLRKKYFDATHHCYAFRLGFDKSVYRFNDDGEPSGTAGRPIYGQILSKDLTNVLVVVVRYYGGTKLGVPGLINAYKTAAKEALDNNNIIEKTVNDVYRVVFSYEQMNDVMRILKDDHIKQLSQNFDNKCAIEFSVRKLYAGKTYEKLCLIKGVEVEFLRTV